jgi:adenosylmethionine-8-amino-7-oxononanoate aminotransferase
MQDYFEKIAHLPHVGDIRQCGLMAGIEIVKDKNTKVSFDYEKTIGAKLCAAMRPKGVMLRPLGDVIVLMPPIAIDIDTLTELLTVVYDTLASMEGCYDK